MTTTNKWTFFLSNISQLQRLSGKKWPMKSQEGWPDNNPEDETNEDADAEGD